MISPSSTATHFLFNAAVLCLQILDAHGIAPPQLFCLCRLAALVLQIRLWGRQNWMKEMAVAQIRRPTLDTISRYTFNRSRAALSCVMLSCARKSLLERKQQGNDASIHLLAPVSGHRIPVFKIFMPRSILAVESEQGVHGLNHGCRLFYKMNAKVWGKKKAEK